jgi:hypothetical protein
MADSPQAPSVYNRVTSSEPLEPIVQGQAVNLWALYYTDTPTPVPNLPDPALLVSRDLDILGDRATFDRVKEKTAQWRSEVDGPTGGQAVTLTPKPGERAVVGYIRLDLKSGGSAVIEVIPRISGLTDDDTKHFANISVAGHQYQVLNPVSLYKAKLYNVTHIPQDDAGNVRQDVPQLKALHLIVPRFLRDYHENLSPEASQDISILAGHLRVLQSAVGTAEARQVMARHGLTPSQLVPLPVHNSPFLEIRQAAVNLRAALNPVRFRP